MQRQSDLDQLRRAGLAGDKDLFAGSWASARNRWMWLAVNVATAFVSSRVIGAFEGTLGRRAALGHLGADVTASPPRPARPATDRAQGPAVLLSKRCTGPRQRGSSSWTSSNCPSV
jgi:hypothetical protein